MINYNLLIVTSIAIATGFSFPEEKEIPDNPNIIYILADDMGYGDVSS